MIIDSVTSPSLGGLSFPAASASRVITRSDTNSNYQIRRFSIKNSRVMYSK